MIDVGQQLGGYTILRRIGRGGMGDVFLAQHRRVARRAAVKVLIPELSQKATVLDRFFNEARATSLIKHPGIVEILDCDVLDGQAFIVMEFLDGESLGAYLHRTGPLQADLEFFLGLGSAVASAVGAAHATGIIHRDLKPDNVYLHLAGATSSSVTAKVLDFGIAKLTQQDGGPSQTSTGMLLGTPAYMSPEQCRGAGRVDARSDIYSLGCILYEALLGWPPFVREGMGDLIIAHVSEVPEAPAERIRGLSPEVNSLVMRMLAKSADDRPQTMEAVAVELAACARALGMALDRQLAPRTPVERPQESVETGPTYSPPTPAQPTPVGSSTRGTMPLRPAVGSGPISGDGSRRPASGPVYSPPSEDDEFAHPQPGTGAGGTRVLERPKSTTFSSAASEIGTLPRAPVSRRTLWLGAAAAGVLVLGGVVAVVRSGGAPGGTTANVSSAGGPSPAGEAVAPGTPNPTAIRKAVATPPGEQRQPGPPDTVRIEMQGVPAQTVVTVDGKPGSLPVVLPHGAEVHRIVLRPPGGLPERELQIDGTKDRLLQLVFEEGASAGGKASGREHSAASAAREGARERGGDKEGNRRATRGGAERKPSPGSTDREAITDL